MGVNNDTIQKNQEEIEDNISNESEENLDQDKLAALKAKMANKQKESSVPPKIVEKKKRSLNFGIVGTGQAGSRVAEEFYKMGYATVAFNTAPQDLEAINIPEGNKYLLEYGIGGAAKDTDIGKAAAETHRQGIVNVVDDVLGDSQVFLLCLSLGGGSGAGSHETMIDVLSETGKPIVVITILPMSTEDAQTKQNSLNTLASLATLASNKVIANLIVVDNAKLESIYSDVSHMNFFSVGNQAIVKTIDTFNSFSSMSSLEKSLDPMEWAKLFTDGEGLCVYGEVVVQNYDDDETAIAEAIINNHESGLLSSGFDLAQARYAGALIIANSKAWENIPRGSVDYAMSLIQENCPGADGVFRGAYVDDSIDEDVVKVFSMFSGLGMPSKRVDQLRKDVSEEKKKTQERAKSRNTNLTIDTGTEKTVSKADEIRSKIAKNKSSFSKNFAGGKSFDFRKK